jgi:hypothetical protein
MSHKISFIANKEYFSEMCTQSLRYTNRWRKFERILGPIFFVIGLYILFKTNWESMASYLLVFIGAYETFSPLIKKPIWVHQQLKSKIANKDIELRFFEEGFESVTANSKSFMKWEGVERVAETPKGIFIWPQKRVHIYIQKSVAGDEVIEYIKNKNGLTNHST